MSVNDEGDCSSFKAERATCGQRAGGRRAGGLEPGVGSGDVDPGAGHEGMFAGVALISLSLCPLGLALLIARACTTANAAVTNNGSSYMKLEFVTEFVTTLYSVLFVSNLVSKSARMMVMMMMMMMMIIMWSGSCPAGQQTVTSSEK